MLTAMAVFFVSASSAKLAGSDFETFNGSLTDSDDHDWNPAGSPTGNVGPIETITCPTLGAGTNCGVDLTGKSTDPATGNGDNAFGQGAKNDDVSPAIVFGSIPPNKDDLSRFYVNQEHAADDFLYLAWERTNLLGSAHMDFEFNQLFCNPSATPTNCSGNGVTPLRSEDDLLIDFDFGGSGPVDLTVHRWVVDTDTPSTDCEAVSSGSDVDCWSKGTDLIDSGFAEASVNRANVIDNNPPGAPRTLVGEVKTQGQGETVSSTFGEAGINLSDAEIFPSDECAHFGSAYLKSRSSGQSFSSELKDFITPIPVNISNCGTVIIRKVTDPAGDTETDFCYTTDVDTSPATTTSPFDLKDGESNEIVNVLEGSYNVTEDDPSGDSYALDDIDCEDSTVPDANIDIDVQARTVDFDLAPNETLDCTFTNALQVGALKILKQSTKAGNPLVSTAGAEFCYSTSNGCSTTNVTDNGTGDEDADVGEVCVSGLSPGAYKVNETAAPSGYGDASQVNQSVTVVAGTGCGASDTAPGTGATATFTNPPLADLLVRVDGQASGEIASSIECVQGTTVIGTTDDNDADSDPDFVDPAVVDVDDLEPETYVCTVVIDP
jgi:hypothetical protein